MGDFAVVTGDQAIFDPTFGDATVTAPPGIITGSSSATVGNATVCVAGDESTVIVTTATYMTPSFPTPGSGVLTISSLGSDQEAQKVTSSRLAVILVGSQFRASFRVTAPATQPATPAADAPGRVYEGTGTFVTANRKTQAT
jgi:hypothetical protein